MDAPEQVDVRASNLLVELGAVFGQVDAHGQDRFCDGGRLLVEGLLDDPAELGQDAALGLGAAAVEDARESLNAGAPVDALAQAVECVVGARAHLGNARP